MKIFLNATFLILLSPMLCGQTKENQNVAANSYFAPLKYRSIGPFRGGRSVCASGVTGDPLTYYMGTTGGGLWKTSDAGQVWYNISDGFFRTGSVGAVAVSSSDPNVVYCGMGEHAPRGVMTSYGDGVYKSTDAGKTWVHLGLAKTQHIARIVIHPKNPDIVYVAAQGQLYGPNEERGIYKSTDGGKTWRNVLFVNQNTGCSELSMDLSNPNVLYAAMWHHQRLPWKVISGGEGSGLYKSTDGGETWKQIEKGLPDELGKMAVSVSQSNPDKVYALVESDTQKDLGGLFVSQDGGDSWTRVSDDNRLTQRAWYYIEVFADPLDEHTVYVLSAPALRSIDGGKTWERLTGTHGDFHDLWINPDNPANLCIANDGGAAISFNQGKSWSRQDNMPTAQIYRVNVDNGFPYKIYGGQQDNTSIAIAHRETGSSGINPQSWYFSAGGESAFLAFDPDDPALVLGGSYLGTIEVFDARADAGTNIMAAPIQYLGRAASDMKYRFNWNAPIIWSQHEPNTFYHAAQVLLRTRDLGETWEEVSPDLSRNEKDRQVKGGGPYTVEAVGAENYGTISYVIESPHEAGVIWVATDDGKVQLTRDGCKTWQNVTPRGLPDCLVNAIDISPHDPATAYIATTRYKFNDHTPALYKTNDYGRSWTNISQGIPGGAFTRVVREDEARRGLLFAGTETGIYVSWDDGSFWEPLQLNLPVTPITDLMVRHDDLIVATSGRSIWILDDLPVLRQHAREKSWQQANGKLIRVYEPEPVIPVGGSSQLDKNDDAFKGADPLRGVNPASGVVVYYSVGQADAESPVILEITDNQGKLINRFTSVKDSTFSKWDGGPPVETVLDKQNGLNRFVWDMRHATMPGVPGVYIEGSYRGHKVPPGMYTVTIRYNDQSSVTHATVLPNPTFSTTADMYAEYDAFMESMELALTEMHQSVNDLEEVRTQIKDLLPRIEERGLTVLHSSARQLLDRIRAWDEQMVQRKAKAYDDVENFENKFTANYLFLINQTESVIPRINQSSRERHAELSARWNTLKTEANTIGSMVSKLNQQLWEAGIGAIWTGRKDRS